MAFVLLMGSAPALGAPAWENVGPAGGYIKSAVISPAFDLDQTLFMGGKGGVFRSSDGGATWEPVNNGLRGIYVADIVLSPNFATDQTLFAGTWEGGLFKSTNGGDSWTAVNNGLSAGDKWISSLAITSDYGSSQTVFAGSHYGGVFRSTNGGGNWTPMNNGLRSTTALSIAVSPNYTSDKKAFVASSWWWGEVYATQDGGANWNGVGPIYANTVEVSPNFANDGGVFAATRGRVWVSTNGGVTFDARAFSSPDAEAWNVQFSPVTDVAAVATDRGIYFSDDFGADWQLLPGVTTEVTSVMFDQTNGSHVYATTWNGAFYESGDGAATWSLLGYAGNMREMTSVAVPPAYPTDPVIFAGMAHTGFVKLNRETGAFAETGVDETRTGIQNIHVSPNFASDGTIFGSFQGSLYRSRDAGLTWQRIFGSAMPGVFDMSDDFGNDGMAVAGTWYRKIHITKDGGDIWSESPGALPSYPTSAQISPNYAVDKKIWVGTQGGGIFMTGDAHTAWQPVAPSLAGTIIDSLFVPSEFATDPTATIFAGTRDDGIWESTDGGLNFVRSSAPGADWNIQSFCASPSLPGVTLAGTEENGLKVNFSGFPGWHDAGCCGFAPDVRDCAIAPNGNVFAASYGGSIWYLPSLSSLKPPPTTSLVMTPDVWGSNGWRIVKPSIMLKTIVEDVPERRWNSGTWESFSGDLWSAPSLLSAFNAVSTVTTDVTAAFYPPEGQNTLWYRSLRPAEGLTEEARSQLFRVDTRSPGKAWMTVPAASVSASKSASFTINWNGSDPLPGSGMLGYQVMYRIKPYTTWNNWKPLTTTKSALFPGAQGKTYQFIARGRDKAGRFGAWSDIRQTAVPVNETFGAYRGSWSSITAWSSPRYAGTAKWTKTRGASATFTATGKSYSLLVTRAPSSSAAKVYVNGRYVKTVDTGSSTTQFRQAIPLGSYSTAAKRTIRINNVATSGRPYLEIDGLLVVN